MGTHRGVRGDERRAPGPGQGQLPQHHREDGGRKAEPLALLLRKQLPFLSQQSPAPGKSSISGRNHPPRLFMRGSWPGWTHLWSCASVTQHSPRVPSRRNGSRPSLPCAFLAHIPAGNLEEREGGRVRTHPRSPLPQSGARLPQRAMKMEKKTVAGLSKR